MSKKIIAGAGVLAGLAVALAPVASFATSVTQVTSHTDTLNLNIPQICTLGTVTNGQADDPSDATTHNPGETTYTGSWANGTQGATAHIGRTDTLSATVYNGQAYPNLGATVFTIRCNDSDGYTLSAQAVAGSATGEHAAVAGNLTRTDGLFNIPTKASGTLTADNGSYWNFKFAVSNSTDQTIATDYDEPHAVPTSPTVIVTGHGAGNTNTGDKVTVTYGAGIDAYQETGEYDGSVLYTLADVDPQP